MKFNCEYKNLVITHTTQVGYRCIIEIIYIFYNILNKACFGKAPLRWRNFFIAIHRLSPPFVVWSLGQGAAPSLCMQNVFFTLNPSSQATLHQMGRRERRTSREEEREISLRKTFSAMHVSMGCQIGVIYPTHGAWTSNTSCSSLVKCYFFVGVFTSLIGDLDVVIAADILKYTYVYDQLLETVCAIMLGSTSERSQCLPSSSPPPLSSSSSHTFLHAMASTVHGPPSPRSEVVLHSLSGDGPNSRSANWQDVLCECSFD